MIEGVDVQRNVIVKEAGAGANHRAGSGKGSPGYAYARRHTETLGHFLRFHANAQIQSQARGKVPMVLGIDGVLGILDGVRARRGEGDLLGELVLRIQNVDGPLRTPAVVIALCRVKSELDIMDAFPL